MIPQEMIEQLVKELSKQSTAPDKETPDWMEADIRRGLEAGYQLALKQFPMTPPFTEMSFKEMCDNLFNLDFMSEEEKQTIFEAGEMYANGCVKQANKAKDERIKTLQVEKEAMQTEITCYEIVIKRQEKEIEELKEKVNSRIVEGL